MIIGPPRKDVLTAHLMDIRWRHEVGGVDVSVGAELVPLSTDRGDDRAALQSTYSAIRDGLRVDGDRFKFKDGISRPVSNAEMLAAIVTGFRHVQGAFNAEGVVQAQIEAGTLASRPQVEEAFTAAIAAASEAAP